MDGDIDSVDKYLAVLDTFSPEILEWKTSRTFRERLEAIRKTQIGSMIEDFHQLDSLGKNVSFKSFKGRYVLLELWASWCVPCRKKNPDLVSLYNKYSNKNFTILGVALEQKNDRDK